MPDRRDYLTVCNNQGVALPDFQAMFCVRCVQPECSRSRSGGLFETRISTWQERLFTNPARMSVDDPLYSVISAKRFIEIGGSPEGDGKAEWLDPRALEEPTHPVAKPRAARAPRSLGVEPEAPVEAVVVPVVAPVTRAGVEEGVAPESQPTPRGALNTPFEQGVMLNAGAVAAAPKKPADPWAAALPPPVELGPISEAPIVKAGAKIKFRAGPV